MPLLSGQIFIRKAMSPLQIFRIFDYQQPNSMQNAARPNRGNSPVRGTSNTQTGADETFIERRQIQDRRASDRREKQQSTFLNTRKKQGRRQTAGRRASDANIKLDYRPISLKG